MTLTGQVGGGEDGDAGHGQRLVEVDHQDAGEVFSLPWAIRLDCCAYLVPGQSAGQQISRLRQNNGQYLRGLCSQRDISTRHHLEMNCRGSSFQTYI